jgi:hypothetical protein
MNWNSTIFPAYSNNDIFKNLDTFNFTFDPIFKKLIKIKYPNYYTSTIEEPTTLKHTIEQNNSKNETIFTEEPTTDITNREQEDYYPNFSLFEYKEYTEWFW